jgi:FkbM family methyltransferase
LTDNAVRLCGRKQGQHTFADLRRGSSLTKPMDAKGENQMEFGLKAQYMDYVEKRRGRKLVLFGAGANAVHIIATYFPLERIEFIVDNNVAKHGRTLLNIQILSPDALKQTPDDYVVIITINGHYNVFSAVSQLKRLGVRNYYKSIILSLQSLTETYDSPWINGFLPFDAFELIENNKANINKVRTYLSDEKSITVYDAMIEKVKYALKDYTDISDGVSDEYFNDGIFEYGNREVFVDGGAYDGTDTIAFAEMLGDKLKKAILFEPDDTGYLRTLTNLSEHLDSDKYEIYKVALSNRNAQSAFFSSGGEDARICEIETEKNRMNIVKTACLEDILPPPCR